MQAPNAQGIMGLMSQGRAPQQPQQPMPSPMKASPMAAVGSVEDRVAAYRGNPAPLQQRYAMSQDLLDLLALQKIKSEKEAAARQMQMQMAQQGAAQGDNMTIAQQREKEVLDLTKNELAQQRGETAQQQVGEQQAALQKLMSGIARAPGAQGAAQPKAMASGGIVAFASGDPVEDSRRKRREGESFEDFRQRMLQLDAQIQQEREASVAAAREAERQRRLAERGGPLIPPSPFFERRPLPVPSAQAAPTPAGPAVSDVYPDETRRGAAAGLVTLPAAAGAGPAAPRPVLPTADVTPTPRPAAPAPAAPAPAAPAGPVAGGPVAPTMRDVNLIPGVEQSIRQDVMRDPEAAQLAQEERVRKMYALTPEQRAVYEQGIAQRQKMFEEAYDPERQRREALVRFLIGAGGRRYNEFGAGAASSIGYANAQEQARLKDFEALQKSREGLVGLEREGIPKAIEAGLKGLEATSAQRRQGQAAGANIYGTESQAESSRYSADTSRYGTDVQARTADLNRVVEQAKVAAQNAATAAQREGLDFSRMQGHLNTVVTNRARAVEAVNKRFGPQINMLEMQLQAAPNDKKLQEQRNALALQIEAEVDKVTKPFDDAEAIIQSRLYGSSGGTGGYTVREKKPAR